MSWRPKDFINRVVDDAAQSYYEQRAPIDRGRTTFDMAKTPEQRQQWRAWANNPQLHHPDRMKMADAGDSQTSYNQWVNGLRNEVYGGPMSQPPPTGGQPRGPQPRAIQTGSARNQMLGRVLRQAGK